MRHRVTLVSILLLASLAGFGTGCKKKPPVTPPPPPPPAEKAEPAPPPKEPVKEVTESFPKEPVEVAEPSVDELNRQQPLKTVYFDYDRFDLDDEDRNTLQHNAQWLKTYPKRTIRIEGHCDERGTIKYNLALGERRANSVREYLVSLGIDSSRMRIVSYGEERPADQGHSEEAWAKNRRGEFYIEQ